MKEEAIVVETKSRTSHVIVTIGKVGGKENVWARKQMRDALTDIIISG